MLTFCTIHNLHGCFALSEGSAALVYKLRHQLDTVPCNLSDNVDNLSVCTDDTSITIVNFTVQCKVCWLGLEFSIDFVQDTAAVLR